MAEQFSILQTDLTCAICKDIYVNPLILNCSHTFCKLCLYTWLGAKTFCPECRVEVSFHTENLALRNVIDKMIEKGDPEIKQSHLKLISQRANEERKCELDGLPPVLREQDNRSSNDNSRSHHDFGVSYQDLSAHGYFRVHPLMLGPRALEIDHSEPSTSSGDDEDELSDMAENIDTEEDVLASDEDENEENMSSSSDSSAPNSDVPFREQDEDDSSECKDTEDDSSSPSNYTERFSDLYQDYSEDEFSGYGKSLCGEF